MSLPAARGVRATVVGLITDTNKPLAYRLLAWHGTMLVALNL